MTNLRDLKLKTKTWLYNRLIGKYTIHLYRNFFEKVLPNSTILDIGVGDGHSILENIDLIIAKNLKIYAIDINKDEIAKFKKQINDKNIHDYFELFDTPIQDIYDNNIPNNINYVFFSNSYSVIPNVCDTIIYIKNHFSPKNYVISTTLGDKPNSIMSFIKPNLSKILLGIDFGRYITYNQFISEINSCSLNIIHNEITHTNYIPPYGNINIYTFILKSCQ